METIILPAHKSIAEPSELGPGLGNFRNTDDYVMENFRNIEDYTPIILGEFEKMRQIEFANGERFKVMAYLKAIDAIKSLNKPIIITRDVIGVKHIGKKLLAKIAEIIQTGALAKARLATTDPDTIAINEIAKIYKVGMVTARKLVLEHGIKSIEALRARQDEFLDETQKIGLKYLEDMELRIPYDEVCLHRQFLLLELSSMDLLGEITGSFRRGSKDSGDIDLLISCSSQTEASLFLDHGGIEKLVQRLFSKGYLTDKLSQGHQKFGGICKLLGSQKGPHRRIDILFTPPSEYPFALLYFTGPKLFNTAMREQANRLGYSLNEKKIILLDERNPLGISDPAVSVFQTEKDIMKFLGYGWLEPRNRAIEPKAVLTQEQEPEQGQEHVPIEYNKIPIQIVIKNKREQDNGTSIRKIAIKLKAR